jgi:hypothetical protein
LSHNQVFSRTAVNPSWGDDTFGVLLHGLVASSPGRFDAADMTARLPKASDGISISIRFDRIPDQLISIASVEE